MKEMRSRLIQLDAESAKLRLEVTALREEIDALRLVMEDLRAEYVCDVRPALTVGQLSLEVQP